MDSNKYSSPNKGDDHKLKKRRVGEGCSNSQTYTLNSEKLMLDLKLSSFNHETRPIIKANVTPNEEKRPPTKVFTCNYCKGEFSTSQALGGHQNAHKQERAREKMRHAIGFQASYTSNNNFYHPCFGANRNNNNAPFDGFWKRSPIGVVDTHKPSYPWPITHGYNHKQGLIGPINQAKSSSLLGNSQLSYYDKLKMSNLTKDNIRYRYSPFSDLSTISKSLPTLREEGPLEISDGHKNIHQFIKGEKSEEKKDGGKKDQLKSPNSSLDLSLKL